MKRIPWITLLVSVVATLIQCLGERANDALQWQSDLFASGEVWRVIGGHLCHWNWNHLVWDLAAFAILGWRLERSGRGRFLATLGLTVLATDPLLRCFGAFESYRGLSGLAVALFASTLLEIFEAGWRKGDRALALGGALGFVALAGKLIFEFGTGGALFAESGAFAVAVEAHLAGIVAAVISWWLATRRSTGRRLAARTSS